MLFIRVLPSPPERTDLHSPPPRAYQHYRGSVSTEFSVYVLREHSSTTTVVPLAGPRLRHDPLTFPHFSLCAHGRSTILTMHGHVPYEAFRGRHREPSTSKTNANRVQDEKVEKLFSDFLPFRRTSRCRDGVLQVSGRANADFQHLRDQRTRWKYFSRQYDNLWIKSYLRIRVFECLHAIILYRVKLPVKRFMLKHKSDFPTEI